ncbi:hypothetical protein HYPSUDRAFT_35117 [Hypholoma sublateritium FD-334 SS-4]|uniref:DAGKc domain-containing protein n=1 Tax=Hypholoma sublateritium (strain FD-334 SS-4) TaxID=945553 RepID=A0A0D2LI15_HYPSF|nr:hypothetical protein HYPSUDRAFT_35117 [Hypholoma sublateritium FD-334 SS-4]
MPLIIVNPVCGDRSAPAFFADNVALDGERIETTSAEHAGQAVVARLASESPLTVVLGSGDGTLHDIINALHPQPAAVSFVLVPCGTANALYSSLFPGQDDKLLSLRAFVSAKPPLPLSLATTTIAAKVSVASVVVSTSLHASILHDSEALRAAHPGIERFKLAAQQNSTKWYRARVRLHPAAAQTAVELYDPATRAFRPGPAELAGPFVYFLTTVNVDRLEPAFRITPRARDAPPGTCDVVVIRPLRAPDGATPDVFAATTWAALTAAYNDGAHLDLTYPDGTPIVEYLRCGAWEWIPDVADADAHLVCTDGAILRIPPGGSASCAIDAFPHKFAVYA